MDELQTGASSMMSTAKMRASSSATLVETQSSTDDRVIVKNFQKKYDAWRDAKM